EVEGDDAGRDDVDLEDIAFDEVDDIFDHKLSRHFHGVRKAHRVDLDPDAPRAAVARRVDQDSPVARAEIIDHILRAHFGQLEHALQDRFIAGHEGDVLIAAGISGELFDVVEKKIVEQGSSWI